ncbi:MAG: hypothetical protein ACI9TY_000580 [Alphaproteobacteria bacterium]|jgi:hypothetical protein
MKRIFNSRTGIFIALFAFMTNVALPLFLLLTPLQFNSDDSEQQIASVFGDRILVCTTSGLRWVSLNKSQSENDPQTPHTQYKCALCYIEDNDLEFAFYAQKDFSFSGNVQYSPIAVNKDVATNLYSTHAFSTRAPPYFT